jgi:chorismate mutase/GNAT superfamily N-acetyltransferase
VAPTEDDQGLVVRRADWSDVEALTELYLTARRAAAMPATVHGEEEVRAWLAARVDEIDVWLAEDAEDAESAEEPAPVAFVSFTQTWLDDLYVHPDRQGQGIGTLLLDLVRAQRPGGFSLWVFASNEPARRFYRSRGLVELEQTDGSANDEREPDVRVAWPGERPLEFLRGCIDEVDDELAVLLARRAALTAAVQEHKAASGGRAGHQGRDAAREAEIAARMAAHAPGLGAERLARVVHVVIEESLHAWEQRER